MKPRGKWRGMITIAQFNWPFYLLAGVVLIASLAGLVLLSDSALKLVAGIAFVGAAFFLFGSLTRAPALRRCIRGLRHLFSASLERLLSVSKRVILQFPSLKGRKVRDVLPRVAKCLG